MAYIGMAYIVMVYIVMAYIALAFTHPDMHACVNTPAHTAVSSCPQAPTHPRTRAHTCTPMADHPQHTKPSYIVMAYIVMAQMEEGQRVHHKKFGTGEIVKVKPHTLLRCT